MKTTTKHKANLNSAKMSDNYNLTIGYDAILETEVRKIVEDNNIKTKFFTETFLLIVNITKENADKIKELFKGLNFKFKSRKNGNIKIYKIIYMSLTKAKKMPFGRTVRKNKKKRSGTTHSSGTNRTNYEKRLSKTIKKATLYIAKMEAKKRANELKKAKTQPVQLSIDFEQTEKNKTKAA